MVGGGKQVSPSSHFQQLSGGAVRGAAAGSAGEGGGTPPRGPSGAFQGRKGERRSKMDDTPGGKKIKPTPKPKYQNDYKKTMNQ